MRLSWIVRVKLLDLDLLLVFVGVVEDNDLHRAFEGCGVLEVYGEATLADFVLRFLPGLLELAVQLLEVGGRRSLCTFLSDFVGSTWGFNLEVDLLVLFIFALWFQNAFVPHFILMLCLLLLGSKLILLAF